MDMRIYLYTVLKYADISIMADTGTSWFMPFDIKRFQDRPRTLLKSWKMTLGIKKCLQICPLTYIYTTIEIAVLITYQLPSGHGDIESSFRRFKNVTTLSMSMSV